MYKKYSREEQKELATWAADCAERVLPLFEQAVPTDDRPRKAIEQCREWARTGVFSMAVIRHASLSAHAAAREAPNDIARYAARAAGQAVATAHVPQHAFGAAYYALKAIAATDPANAEVDVKRELEWETLHLSENLREELVRRVMVSNTKMGVTIKIDKSGIF
ncbi:hypothetical protein Dform_02142 [Dehalogenimonas formicexedens]|uniref:Imm-5-like domain-containing protein n=1 Tax=Dehalogenimonas formicexedens TaxID=1839801 RepID=A0A1P8FAF3_9CHLR|nr:hypothetical protein [Dehalogenimonas formicexedens]APV45446.1 hypothetical protein Dform_02142 [Dehalogenimonas formicexedens]